MSLLRSLAGTHWQCTNTNMNEYKRTAVILDGNMDPDWNGQNPIDIQYDNGQKERMTLREFQASFKQIIQQSPRTPVQQFARRCA